MFMNARSYEKKPYAAKGSRMKIAGKVLLLILVVSTIGCDRVTKHLATMNLAGTPPQSYFADTVRLEYSENSGAFLSLGAELPTWVRKTIFTLGVGLTLTLLAVVGLKRYWTGSPFVGAALMWAGGTSNLIDRAAHGSVVDFINVGVGSLRTGIFNIADLAIVLGFALVVIGFRQMRE
jgi:signal peptidase II